MKDQRVVSGQDLARLCGCTDQTIQRLVSRGILHRTGRNAFDLAESLAAYISHLRTVAAGRASPASKELQEARAAIVTFRRRRLEREDRREAGELIGLDARPARMAKFIETALLRHPGMLADILDAAPMLRLEVAERITMPETEPA